MARMSEVWPCTSAVMRRLLGSSGGRFYDTVKHGTMHYTGSSRYMIQRSVIYNFPFWKHVSNSLRSVTGPVFGCCCGHLIKRENSTDKGTFSCPDQLQELSLVAAVVTRLNKREFHGQMNFQLSRVPALHYSLQRGGWTPLSNVQSSWYHYVLLIFLNLYLYLLSWCEYWLHMSPKYTDPVPYKPWSLWSEWKHLVDDKQPNLSAAKPRPQDWSMKEVCARLNFLFTVICTMGKLKKCIIITRNGMYTRAVHELSLVLHSRRCGEWFTNAVLRGRQLVRSRLRTYTRPNQKLRSLEHRHNQE